MPPVRGFPFPCIYHGPSRGHPARISRPRGKWSRITDQRSVSRSPIMNTRFARAHSVELLPVFIQLGFAGTVTSCRTCRSRLAVCSRDLTGSLPQHSKELEPLKMEYIYSPPSCLECASYCLEKSPVLAFWAGAKYSAFIMLVLRYHCKAPLFIAICKHQNMPFFFMQSSNH